MLDLNIGFEPFDCDAVRHGALDGGDWSTLALTILADPATLQLPRDVVADCMRIAMAEAEPTDVEWRKLMSLSDWLDSIGAPDV